MSNTLEYYKQQISLARTEIKNLRQQLSSLKQEHLKEIRFLKSMLNNLKCGDCAEAATTYTPNNPIATSPTARSDDHIEYQPIGVIETVFQNKRGVPRQPSVMQKATGTVVINTPILNNPDHALSGLEEFSHMWIIFHFHETESTSVSAKVAPPRLRGERRGVFSTRSPHRPCTIGLSLVKIQKIEGNRIHFLGVDMVNGTPVLDIKPFIPQYDYPTPSPLYQAMTSRPPTEGTSDVVDNMAALGLDDDAERQSPPEMNALSVDTSPSYDPELPSPETTDLPIHSSPDSPSSIDLLDGSNNSPQYRPNSVRGAPDGQERFTPPQTNRIANLVHDGIRIAPWISNPPAQTYQVVFTEDCIERLNELIGNRSEAFKSNIECLLSEDPRSQYVRNRYPDHEYNCVLEDLSISCVFDSSSLTCTIVALRSAEDMQS